MKRKIQLLYDVCGECALLRRLLSRLPPPLRIPLEAVDAVLRGVAQVCFANNPISGLLMLLGLFLAEIPVGLAALVCSMAAWSMATYCGLHTSQVQNGLTQFNAVLVGSVVASLWPVLGSGPLTYRLWTLLILGAATSVIVDRAVAAFLAGVKASYNSGSKGKESAQRLDLGVPGFTLPFNMVGWVIWSVLLRVEAQEHAAEGPVEEIDLDIDWLKLCLGSVYAMGQVYGVHSLSCSILMYLGVAIFSPTIALVQWLGALIACFAALMVGPPPYTGIYIGVWSYSALLTAGATVYFTRPTFKSLPLHLLAVLSTVCLHSSLVPVFQQFRLPVFTLPFVLTSWCFLLFNTGNGVVVRSADPLTPEQRVLKHREATRVALASIVTLSAGIVSGGLNTTGMTTVGMTNAGFTLGIAGQAGAGSQGEMDKKALKVQMAELDRAGVEEAVLAEEESWRKELLDKFYNSFNPGL